MDPADFREIVREVRRFVRNEVVPAEAAIDERDEIPEQLVIARQLVRDRSEQP
jgi:acyl-CoA dehydrogenase